MKRSKEKSILDFCVGNTHISAGHTCHMLASFFLQIFSFLRVISRQETSLPLLDPRSAYTFVSSGWLFPEASQCCGLASVCFLEVVEIFIIQVTSPSAKNMPLEKG